MCWKWCFASFFGERGHWTLDEVCHLIFHIVKENFIFQTKWKEHWMGAILHIKAMRFSMVSSVVPWLLHDWIAGRQLEVDGTLASTSRHIILKEASARHTMEILVGKERNLKPAWKHFECLKMTKATWVFDFLWLCSLLVRDNVSAEHGWAKITEVLNQVTRLVVDSNGCGDSSITILAHKVPGSWVSHWPNSSISPSSHLFWSWFQQSWLTRCQSLGSVTGPATGSTLRILWAKIVGTQIIMKD